MPEQSSLYPDPNQNSTQKAYNQHAADLSVKYNAISSPLSRQTLFPKSGPIIDIGAGSSRDLDYLQKKGFAVYGLDASKAMVDQSVSSFPQLKHSLFCGSFPQVLEDNRFPDHWPGEGEYNGIICSALIQHIEDIHLFSFFFGMQRLLAQGGLLWFSYPLRYPDNDPYGRVFHIRPTQQYASILERLGFTLITRDESKDGLQRQDISWVQEVWEKRKADGLRPLDKLESVLREDRKVNSYKFALLRGLFRLSSGNGASGKWQPDGRVAVELNDLAHQWIRFYWPIVQAGDIIQGQLFKDPNRQDMSFRLALKNMTIHWDAKKDGMLKFFHALESGTLSAEEKELYKEVLIRVKAGIKQPVQYAGNKRTGELFESKEGRVFLDGELWKDLALYGRWFEDTLLMRWAEFTYEKNQQKFPERKLGYYVKLLMEEEEILRDTHRSRAVFDNKKDTLFCVWSGKTIKEYDLDHLIPYSCWKNNFLWNLLPAKPSLNRGKSDKLPSNKAFQDSKERIFHYWELLSQQENKLFLYEAGQFLGYPVKKYDMSVERSIFTSLKDTTEMLALQTGAERWEGE